MPQVPPHLSWLSDTGSSIVCSDATKVSVWRLNWVNEAAGGAPILSSWANHIRAQYCLDAEIDKLRAGTGLSRSEYLLKFKFPSTTDLGPGIRSGDFGELLTIDFVEHVLGYWVPKTKFSRKQVRDESTKGCDIIGFKLADAAGGPADEVIVFEAKARLTTTLAIALSKAIESAVKDPLRLPESLNAIKQRLIDVQDEAGAATIARFQDAVSRPFVQIQGASAISNHSPIPITTQLPAGNGYRLIAIGGEDLMSLVNRLYALGASNA